MSFIYFSTNNSNCDKNRGDKKNEGVALDMEKKIDIIFFNAGSDRVNRKAGHIEKISEGFIYFLEDNKSQLIPVYRVVRVERGQQ